MAATATHAAAAISPASRSQRRAGRRRGAAPSRTALSSRSSRPGGGSKRGGRRPARRGPEASRAGLRHPRLLPASSFVLVPAGFGLFVVRVVTLALRESRVLARCRSHYPPCRICRMENEFRAASSNSLSRYTISRMTASHRRVGAWMLIEGRSDSLVQRGRPIRRTRSSKRGSERRGSKPGRSRTLGLNRSS